MLAYALRRATWAVMLCLTLSLFTFVIFYVVPRGQNTQQTRGTLTDIQRAQQFSGPGQALARRCLQLSQGANCRSK